jgi:hypothetical protein
VGQDGETVVAKDVIKQNGGISGGAFGVRATFNSGVQFMITDPAYGLQVGWELVQMRRLRLVSRSTAATLLNRVPRANNLHQVMRLSAVALLFVG